MADSPGSDLAAPSPKSRALPSIACGGVIAGVLDLTYAILVDSPTNLIRIPQTIASGVLGAKSFGGGVPSAALGVVLHLAIALGAAAVYYLASRKLAILVRSAVLSGLVCGALVYLFRIWSCCRCRQFLMETSH